MNEMKKTLNHILVKLFNRILVIEEEFLRKKGIDLTINEIHVLEKVRNSKTKIMSDIAKSLNITQSTMSINSKRLIKKGFLIKEQDNNDKRVIRLKISDTGLKYLQIHDRFHKKMIDHVIKDLDLEQNQTLLESLNSLVNFFEENYKHYK